MKDKFYGDKKITDITDGPTDVLKKLSFSDGSSQIVHNEVLAGVVSDEPIDATTERHNRNLPIVKAVLETLLKYNVVVNEADFICDRVVLSLNESRAKASNILWKKDVSENTMLDVHDVLMNAPSDGAVLSPPEFVPEAK
jgi:hypothetical protein